MPKTPQKLNTEIGYIKPREITEEMKESYIDYAMSVIVSRALPDVRDGLKPVHRRILYTMREDGLTHGAKYRKSATVVGSCLGHYHPHGDQAVYDSMARMAQDFSLRYPLIDGQGNWGSIDDPSEYAAMRYCITGDSFIVTNRCLEKIGEVAAQEDIDLKVLSFGGKVNSASKWFDSGIHPVVKIETLRGYTLKGSFNHPILTLQSDFEGKPTFKWKLSSEIKEGDFAVIDRNGEALWSQKEPDLKEYYPDFRNRCFALHKLPAAVNPDLAFVMGAILAEGYISHREGKNKREKFVGFCNTDKEFIKTFKRSFKKVFPDCRLHEFERGPLSYGKQKFIALEMHSTYITEFLENLGLRNVRAPRKQIPHIIYHSTKESVAAFLRGFSEGDGSIYVCSDKNRKTQRKAMEIVLISSSQKLLEEIQIILLRFSIDSFLRYDQTRKMWRLFIHGHNNFNLFANHINFVSREKKRRLKKFSQFNSDNRIMSKTDFIPFLADYLRKKYKKYKSDWISTHNIDRYQKLRKYFPKLKQILKREDLALIGLFLSQYYLFDRITSVKKAGQERVYSLRIDSDCHSFISNGFISHNTEARMSRVGEEMLSDIDKNTVDFVDNFDGTRKEPRVLPSPLPQLLLNGSLGIAVGMATNIPPHNLSEVIDACIYLIDHPKVSTEDLFQFIKGPDFPTGGSIFNQREIIEAYSQGKGAIVIRGKAEIVESGKTDRTQIVITEIPFQVLKSSLIEQFANLVQEKRIDGIKDIRDESDKEGLRIVIELQRDAYPQKILNRLYKFTNLQKTFHLNMLALVGGIQPGVLSLNEVLNYFLEHRKEVVYRRTQYNLEKAKERSHILEGLHRCLANIDAVIRTIKNSASREDALKNLMRRFRLTQIQANAILETKLSALAKLERKKIEEELKEMRARIREYSVILKSPQKIKEVVKKELKEARDNFGDERKTKIHIQKIGEIAEEDLIPQEETIITLTQGGYVKRINPSSYKKQKRGGRGMIGMKTIGEDIVEHFLTCMTHDSLLFFTDSGKVFRTQVYEIPEGIRLAKGRGLLNFLEISAQEKVLSLHPVGKEDKDRGFKYLVMVTKDGIIKKTALEEFENVRRSGLIAVTLRRGDSLRKVAKTTGSDEIILITKKGQSIKFKEKDIRPMGRQAAGIRGIRLRGGDEVIGMDVIQTKNEKLKTKNYLLVVTENGFGKRTDLREYKVQGRGGSGIKTANITLKTGELVAAMILTGDEEDLIVISRRGHVIRTKIGSVSKLNRATQGVRIMRLEPGDKVASATCI